MSRARRSAWANERGRVLADRGDDAGALEAYQEATELDPANAHAWFNMALLHKQRRAWGEAVRCGERSATLQPDDYPTWWNLGIAATALGRWALARTAWRHCGVDVPEGDGPIEALGLGLVPIRLNPDGDAEVVWAERLDPARARLVNVPLPSSGHRWADVVLHDGVPVGERVLHGQAVPVFDELELLFPSDLPTLEVHVTAPTPEDADALEQLFFEADRAAQDWTASVRHLCDACSRGSVPAGRSAEGDWVVERHVGLAAARDEAQLLLRAWADAVDRRASGAPSSPTG